MITDVQFLFVHGNDELNETHNIKSDGLDYAHVHIDTND